MLEDAGLLVTPRVGRTRLNHLNPLPIRMIYARWMSGFAEVWSGPILRIVRPVEGEAPWHEALCARKGAGM